jgi:DNA-binding Lrp family transcriptional regulator
MTPLDQLDRDIINALHGGLEVCERPYLSAANRLGIGEEALLERLSGMLSRGIITRVGPLYQIERMGGAFTLAALHAPVERFDDVAQQVNAFVEVAHNYERDHHLNMWFVLATEAPQEMEPTIRRIEEATGCSVFNFPKSREYFVELRLTA